MLEQSSEFHHVGAGIQIPPNAARILQHWSLLPAIEPQSVHSYELRVRRWEDGRILSTSSDRIADKYGTDIYYIHRADFHAVLAEEATRLGVTIRLGCAVEAIEFESGTVILKANAASTDGERIQSDVIVGADGLNSVCRELLLGRKDPPRRTGDLAYRLTVKVSDMRRYEILHELIEHMSNDLWIGPDIFVVGYLLQEDGLYNIVLVAPDTIPEDVDVSKATPEEMKELLKGWDPRLQALLGVVQQTQKWRMLTSREMGNWGHKGGKFVLLGDAAHASLPYLAQGAAMAVEDGAVLGALFDKITARAQIPKLLQAYEDLRKPRVTKVVEGSLNQGVARKFPDGKEQQERDEWLATLGDDDYPYHFTEPGFRDWLMGYDAFAEVDKGWRG
ncbi:MAG: hypothetical protein Q9191_002364 [Dirinaria sp. TL-2023a]